MSTRFFEHAGLDCAVVWHDVKRLGGHHCGYVRVPDDHPWHGLGYRDDVPNPVPAADDRTIGEDIGYIEAFAVALGGESALREFERTLGGQIAVHGGLTYASNGLPGKERRGGWWVGFDCAHADDTPETWTAERTADEVKRLAQQVADASTREARR